MSVERRVCTRSTRAVASREGFGVRCAVAARSKRSAAPTSAGDAIPQLLCKGVEANRTNRRTACEDASSADLTTRLYRLGFAPSRKTARQLITHGHILVNSRPVDIPSYLLRAGDTISRAREKQEARCVPLLDEEDERQRNATMLSLDKASMTGTFLNIPERADIPLNADEQLIVELYSK